MGFSFRKLFRALDPTTPRSIVGGAIATIPGASTLQNLAGQVGGAVRGAGPTDRSAPAGRTGAAPPSGSEAMRTAPAGAVAWYRKPPLLLALAGGGFLLVLLGVLLFRRRG